MKSKAEVLRAGGSDRQTDNTRDGPLKAVSAFLAVVLMGFFSVPPVWAASAGVIKNIQGAALVTRGHISLPASVGQRVLAGDRISAAAGSYVGVTLHDDTRLTIGPNSELAIREFEFNPSSYAGGLAISFLKGTARMVTGIIARHRPDRIALSTPASTIGIRGTDFIVDLEVKP